MWLSQLTSLVLIVQLEVSLAYDWGDFHKFAVIFFSFLGTFVGLSGILAVVYFGCVRAWLARLKTEVAETHRLYHPWPIGSARWHFQKWMRSNRSSSSNKFPPMSASLNRPPPGYLTEFRQPVVQTNFPAYESAGVIRTPSITVDKPSYYVTAEHFSPKLEKIEEYRLIREESILSKGSDQKQQEIIDRLKDRIVRTTTTHHTQQSFRPATYI